MTAGRGDDKHFQGRNFEYQTMCYFFKILVQPGLVLFIEIRYISHMYINK